MESLLLFLLTGAAAGLLAGLFGVGGGLIMVPALAFLLPGLGVEPRVTMHVAVGTSLAVISFTSISSMVSHHRRNGVRWPLFRAFAPGLVLGALLGALLADVTPSEALKRIVGIGALLVALQMLLERQPEARTEKNPGVAVHATAGTTIGLLSALIGIGGGSLTVPYFTWFGIPMRQAVGTASACGVPIAWAGALAFMATGLGEPGRPALSIGYVSLAGFGGLAVASVLAAPLGAHLAHRLPPKVLKKSFAVLLLVIGLGMLLG